MKSNCIQILFFFWGGMNYLIVGGLCLTVFLQTKSVKTNMYSTLLHTKTTFTLWSYEVSQYYVSVLTIRQIEEVSGDDLSLAVL